ncbi:hypothetical protein JTB14_024709 [Gonioctena quinquepunctata]|nr:hypothetical protein JTB14_024709 [Gonioctena quinquepunctata]
MTRMKTIMDMDIHFEHQRWKRRIGQCFNLQKFEHIAAICKVRHCAGNHESQQHDKQDIGPNKCGNCGNSHKSNYRKIIPNQQSRPRRPSKIRENNYAQLSENSPLNYLLLALDDLRELPLRRSILAKIIQSKNFRKNWQKLLQNGIEQNSNKPLGRGSAGHKFQEFCQENRT